MKKGGKHHKPHIHAIYGVITKTLGENSTYIKRQPRSICPPEKMIDPIFLSVIIPAHNEESTICRTVRSLLLQDYSCSEIVVVDDGSDDNTGKKLTDYFGLNQIEQTQSHCPLQYKQIMKTWYGICDGVSLYLLEKVNGGKGDALNAGISFCHGEYYVCTDADCTFATDALSNLSKALSKGGNVVAVGGRVLPKTGMIEFLSQKGFHLRDALQGYQELEYGIVFSVVRSIFDKTRTTMLISGALGLFKKDFIIQLGGYALDTVGEDMELVMRIRKFAAECKEDFSIVYTKEAICYTELPWIKTDFKKQRIRWTVGLSEVLWKYREMAFCKKYSFLEKLTFWYYVLFEKFAPHIGLLSLILCFFNGVSQNIIMLMTATVFLQILISIAGSFQTIKSFIGSFDNKFRPILKVLLLIITFTCGYHFLHSFYRLIAVPVYRKEKRETGNQGPSWISPKRMKN